MTSTIEGRIGKDFVDEEISRNLTGVEEKDIPAQQFLADEGEYEGLMQAVERGQRAGRVWGGTRR